MPKFKYIVIVLAILLATALIAVVLPKLSLRNQYGSMNQADEAVRNLKVMLNRGVTQVQYLINETNFLLANLARSKIIAGKDAKACGSLLASYLKRDEKKFTNFVVADLWGDIWCSSSPINPLEDRINVADRAYFQRVMREGGGGFSAGDYQVGRISGKVIIVFAHPLMNPENNKIDGLVAVGLDLSWLGKWVQNLNMSRDYTFTLLDSEGFVLARYPNDGFAAEKINESEIYENIMMAKSANKNEAIFEASGLNGQKRLFAFADIPNPQAPRTLLDLYLVVGQAIEE